MITELNIVVQSLVWTTLAGLMYAVWLHSRESNGRYSFGLSIPVKNVTNLLQTLWMLLAIGLVITLILFSLPSRAQSAPAAAGNVSGSVASPYWSHSSADGPASPEWNLSVSP
jgi:hypothetical protein